MASEGPLDFLPLWGLFIGTVVLILLSVEGGYRLGGYQHRHSAQEKEGPVGAMAGATLGLLAFLLAFTFGMAASRFDARRQLVLDEANAIGTTDWRAQLLPEPQQKISRDLLRDYVKMRLNAAKTGNLDEVLHESGKLHRKLWKEAGVVAEKDPRAVAVGLYIQSLNEVFDLHVKRVMVGLRNRIPGSIWAVLYLVAILSMSVLGYQSGLAATTRTPAVLALAMTFAAVMFLISDLDRPQEGLLKVSQQAMIDLDHALNAPDK